MATPTENRNNRSLLEQLPEIVRAGKRQAERILEGLESRTRIGLQTRELVTPAKDTIEQNLALRPAEKAKATLAGNLSLINETGGQTELTAGVSRQWFNRLIYGDNLLAMAALLAGDDATPSLRGKIDLFYNDPPFDSKADYRTKITLPGGDVEQKPTVMEQFAYSDTWADGTASYLAMIVPRLCLMRELLSERGSIYIHLDWHVGHYVKVAMDEIFGRDNFINEIVWRRSFGHSDSDRYGNIHDVLMFYGKGGERFWNQVLLPADKEYIDIFFDQFDPVRKERYQRLSLSAGGLSGGGYDYEYKGVRTLWRCPIETLKKHDSENRLHWPKKKGGVPRLKKYESEHNGVPLQDLWTDISKIHNQSAELVGYSTQKPDPKDVAAAVLPLSPGTSAGNSLEVLNRRFERGGTLAYLRDLPSLMVFNDEAHHIHEVRNEGEITEVEWQKSLRTIAESKGSRFVQMDFSATPYNQVGTGRHAKAVYFPHIIADFDLKAAMKAGLVKSLVLAHNRTCRELELLKNSVTHELHRQSAIGRKCF